MDKTNKEMKLSDHLVELRTRVVFSAIIFMINFVFCYYYSNELYQLLLQPLVDVIGQNNLDSRKLIYTGLAEAFFTYLKLALYSSLIITTPFLLIQIYAFISPGLYKKEKYALLPFFVMGPVLFIAGMALVYFYVFPLAWKFFLSFEQAGSDTMLPIQLETKVSEYLSISLQLIFAFGLAFQFPILLLLLVKLGIISREKLKKQRRMAIILIFALAAVITPPDVISQIALAIPMMILYEITILIAKLMEKGQVEEKNA